MTSDDRLADLLERSKGVFIVPNLLTGGSFRQGDGFAIDASAGPHLKRLQEKLSGSA